MRAPSPLAVFKKTVNALIEDMQIESDVVVGLGLTLASAYAVTEDIDRGQLHAMLDQSLDEVLARRIGGAA